MDDIFGINELTLILIIIGQFDIQYIMMLLINTITVDLKVLTYIITSIAASSIVIMSVSTFKEDVIQYIIAISLILEIWIYHLSSLIYLYMPQ
jgi:hypothetical protein